MMILVELWFAHIPTVTCVLGLVGVTHHNFEAAQPDLTMVKLVTLAYWIVFLLRWSHKDHFLVFLD